MRYSYILMSGLFFVGCRITQPQLVTSPFTPNLVDSNPTNNSSTPASVSTPSSVSTDVAVSVQLLYYSLVYPYPFTVGVPIVPALPSGVSLTSAFAIVPPLPSGLSLDPKTGIISGTPVQYLPKTVYTVTAKLGQTPSNALI